VRHLLVPTFVLSDVEGGVVVPSAARRGLKHHLSDESNFSSDREKRKSGLA
jgi:hypothetical protein